MTICRWRCLATIFDRRRWRSWSWNGSLGQQPETELFFSFRMVNTGWNKALSSACDFDIRFGGQCFGVPKDWQGIPKSKEWKVKEFKAKLFGSWCNMMQYWLIFTCLTYIIYFYNSYLFIFSYCTTFFQIFELLRVAKRVAFRFDLGANLWIQATCLQRPRLHWKCLVVHEGDFCGGKPRSTKILELCFSHQVNFMKFLFMWQSFPNKTWNWEWVKDILCKHHRGVSLDGGTPKTPQNDHF